MHLGDEQIQRWLHGELDASSKETLSRHVSGCGECARRIEEARREESAIFDVLTQVDHPVPRVDPCSVAAPARPLSLVWARRAAGFVIAAALAGAAYAIPGSPLPALLRQVSGWITGLTSPPPSPGPPSSEDTTHAGQPVASGIAVEAGNRFSIHFTHEQSDGRATVQLGDGTKVVVRAIGGSVTFTTDVDKLTIENTGSSADYEIELPRGAAWIEITAGPRRVFLKDGDRLLADLPADSLGAFVLPLAAPVPSGF